MRLGQRGAYLPQERGILPQRAHGRHACLCNLRCTLKHPRPFLLQVHAAIQLRSHDRHRKRLRFAQRHRNRRFGQQRMVHTARDEQLHGLQRRCNVAQLEITPRIQALLACQQLKQDVRHVGTKWHGNFLPFELIQCLPMCVA